jgi:hypothetical protein
MYAAGQDKEYGLPRGMLSGHNTGPRHNGFSDKGQEATIVAATETGHDRVAQYEGSRRPPLGRKQDQAPVIRYPFRMEQDL